MSLTRCIPRRVADVVNRTDRNDQSRGVDGPLLLSPPRLLTLGTLALVDGAPGAPALGPRKLALLAYLALANRPLKRDHLAEVFWGDRDDVRARHSLREALSALRRALGHELIARGGDVVALAEPAALVIDARELRAASAARDFSLVLALHAAPFLEGVHVSGASSAFEQWLATERTDLERLFTEACAAEYSRSRALGDWTACAAIAGRWLASSPLDSRAARALLRSHAAPGTREALGQTLDAYARLKTQLESNFGLTPDASVTRLADDYERALAAHGGDADIGIHIAAEALEHAVPSVSSTTIATQTTLANLAADTAPERAIVSQRQEPPRRLTRFAILAAAGVAIVGALGWATRFGERRVIERGGDVAPPYVVVAGTAGNFSQQDCWLVPAMPHMLAASLARATRIETVVLPPLTRSKNGSAKCVATVGESEELDAARRTGATLLVRPTLSRNGAQYTLDLDIREARHGKSLRREIVTDTMPFTLAERAGVALAGVLATLPDRPPQTVVGVDTRSVDAYIAFVDGLRDEAAGRRLEATAALDRAIALDSGFVSAAAERLRRTDAPSTPASADTVHRLMRTLERGADRATPYDRLDFDATIAALNGDHTRAEQLARELSSRFPHDDRARARYVGLLISHGRFEEAVAVVQRALRLDSLTGAPRRGRPENCGMCVNRLMMTGLLVFADRVEEAERSMRELVADFPDWPGVWMELSEVLAGRGRWDEAIAAAERARLAAPTDSWIAFEPARRLVEAGRFDEAAQRTGPWLNSSDREMAGAAADVEAARLRELGRHREAARILLAGTRAKGAPPSADDLVRGASLAALGDVSGVDEAYASPPPHLNGRPGDVWLWRQDARVFAWSRALRADALVVAAEARGETPDTLRLRALADSIEVIGTQSYYARDWRLHHHVRGLIAAQSGRWSAAVAEFEQARWTRTGWTRTLVELARAELELGRPDRALVALSDARSTVLNSMGRYATRTEIALWTARAYDAAGQPDSAQAYAGLVRRAWRDADAPIRRRLAWLPSETRIGARREVVEAKGLGINHEK